MAPSLTRLLTPFFLTLLIQFGTLALPAQESRVHYLSGRDSASAVPWDFKVSSGARAGQWSTLPVPSQWEMHGFGTLSYHSASPAETGFYRLRFPTPERRPGERAILVFEGAMTDTTVTLNGRKLGEVHQGGFYPFQFDVTEVLVEKGENLLEVEVAETSANEGVNKAERTGDYWNFGGLFRPVHLDIHPACHLAEVAIDARADGSIRILTTTSGQAPQGTAVRAILTSTDGAEIGRLPSQSLVNGQVELSGAFPSVNPWSGETPHLYFLSLELTDAKGEVLHRRSERIGFRTFEVRAGDGFYLNGRRIVLLGTNRHSFHPEKGRALAEADHRADLALIREMNNTAVRMSHYPPDKRFLELCDEMGIYVLDELAGWQKSYDTPVGRKLVESMVKRDVNHPSILLWDNGNEGGWNTELDAEFARWDPQRRAVIHPWGISSGVNTAHYKIYAQMRALALGYTTAWNFDPAETPKMPAVPNIYLPTEFLHALFDGGGGAGMEDYLRVMRASPVFGGGFVWALKDEGVKNPLTGQLDLQGNRAPDGVVGPYGEREGSFYTLKELWSPLVVSGPLPAQGDTVIFDFENRYSFTSAQKCSYTWRLINHPVAEAAGPAIAAEETHAFPDVAPGGRGLLHLRLPAGWRGNDQLSVRVTSPDGRELWTYTWPLPGLARIQRTTTSPAASAEPMTLQRDTSGWRVRWAGHEALFDSASGFFTALSPNSLGLQRGPRPAHGEARLVRLNAEVQDGAVLVQADYEGALRRVDWRFDANGWVTCHYTYRTTPDSTSQGVLFDLAQGAVQHKRWIGRGPYRVWQNRVAGTQFGYWENEYNDTATGWSGFVYPEFKGFFADVRWLELAGKSGRLTVVPGEQGRLVQVLRPDFAPAEVQAHTAVVVPDGDLGLLDVIPAIGTKFNRPEVLGPQSEVPVVPEWIHGSVRFHFSAPTPPPGAH